MKWDWKAILGLGISVILLWWVFRDVDPAAVWGEIRGAHWGYLLASIAVATSGFLFRAARWKVLLHPIRPDVPFRSRYAAVNIGFAMNNLLPARVGEFARAWSIAKMERIPMSGALGSLVVERFLDLVAVFALFAVALLHPSFPDGAMVGGQSVSSLATWILIVTGIVLAILLLLVYLPGIFLQGVRVVAAPLPGGGGDVLTRMVTSFLQGIAALRSPVLFAKGLLWSLAFWGWNGVSFWLAFQAFGIELGYIPALFVQAVIAIGVAVPAGPGFFGTFHFAAQSGLHVYGASEAATLAFAFGYHLGGFIPVTLMGLWYAGRLGVSVEEFGKGEVASAVVTEIREETGSPAPVERSLGGTG